MSKSGRTPARAREVLRFIRKVLKRDAMGPSVEEIRREIGWESRNSVVQVLALLAREGLLRRKAGTKFGYVLRDPGLEEVGVTPVPLHVILKGRILPDLEREKTAAQFWVDPRIFGLTRTHRPFAVKFSPAPPPNGLVKTKRQLVVAIPWNERMSGPGWVLADVNASHTTILWHNSSRGRRWLAFDPEAEKGMGREEVVIRGKIVALCFDVIP